MDVADFSLDHMEEAAAYSGAGFSYRMDGAANPTGSMTSSGVGVLAICQEQLGTRFKSIYGNARKSGILWLAERAQEATHRPHVRPVKKAAGTLEVRKQEQIVNRLVVRHTAASLSRRRFGRRLLGRGRWR